MYDYHLDINGEINLSDYSSLDDYLALVGDDDKFTITLDNEGLNSSEIICNLLQNNNFKIKSKGGNSCGGYKISATKKHQ
ncbi:hypothetical protein [Clostridium sp. DL1XJH146]